MHVVELSPARRDLALAELIGPERATVLAGHAQRALRLLAGGRVLSCNATATGGGVAEMLQVLLTTANALGVPTGWWALDGPPEFFAITKRVHNLIHGSPGDRAGLGDADRRVYEEVLAQNLAELAPQLRPGDVMLAHDPQTAGLVPGIVDLGVVTVWRSHIGKDQPDEHTALAWEFLAPYLRPAHAVVVSRPTYAPPCLGDVPLHVIAPSIDPLAPKNADVPEADVHASLVRAGIIAGEPGSGATTFARRDGGVGQVQPHPGVVLDDEPVPADAQVVVQVSRWDRLKDMIGVLDGFVAALDRLPEHAHLLLVGPATEGVSDDPEGEEVLAECRERRAGLPDRVRRRVHLVALPMDDVDENAHLVNCLQRWATIAVQKSCGGLRADRHRGDVEVKPVVASAVGGIQDQITDDVEGVLLDDPTDLAAFGQALVDLFADPARARRLAETAHARVFQDFIGDRHLIQYADLLADLFRDRDRAAD
ncbi:MAG: hypothetical protein R2731_08660 [Nocardioides sp.]